MASVFAWSALTLPGLVHAQDVPPSSSSQPSFAPEIVAGTDVPHWSGLPIWGKAEAEKLGFDLPQPLGLSTTYYTQSEGFRMPELKLGYGGKMLDAGGLIRIPDIQIEESAELVRLDAWVLPFLNLYALAGYMSGHADIAIEPAFLPPGFSPRYNLHLEYQGATVGVGGTLAGGFKPFKDRPTIVFALADLNVTQTYLDFSRLVTSLEPVTVAVLNVRGGVRECIMRRTSHCDIYLSLWAGSMLECVQQVMEGSVTALDLDFQGRIKSIGPWNPIVGAGLEIGEHISLMFDIGFGQRKSLMLSATIRF